MAAAFDRTSTGASSSSSGSHLFGEPREDWRDKGERRRNEGDIGGEESREQDRPLPPPREDGPSVEAGWAVAASAMTRDEELWIGPDDRGEEDHVRNDAGSMNRARITASGSGNRGVAESADDCRRLSDGFAATASAVDDKVGGSPRHSSSPNDGSLNEKGDFERFKNEEGKDINSRLQVRRVV